MTPLSGLLLLAALLETTAAQATVEDVVEDTTLTTTTALSGHADTQVLVLMARTANYGDSNCSDASESPGLMLAVNECLKSGADEYRRYTCNGTNVMVTKYQGHCDNGTVKSYELEHHVGGCFNAGGYMKYTECGTEYQCVLNAAAGIEFWKRFESCSTEAVISETEENENVSLYRVEQRLVDSSDSHDNISNETLQDTNFTYELGDDELYDFDANLTDDNVTMSTTASRTTTAATTTQELAPTTSEGSRRIITGTLVFTVNNAQLFETHTDQVLTALTSGFAKALEIDEQIVTMEIRRRLEGIVGPRYYGKRRLQAGSVPVSFLITNPPSHVPDSDVEIVGQRGDAILTHINEALTSSGLSLTISHVASGEDGGSSSDGVSTTTTTAEDTAEDLGMMGLVADYLPFVVFLGVCALCIVICCICGLTRCCCKHGGCCTRCFRKPESSAETGGCCTCWCLRNPKTPIYGPKSDFDDAQAKDVLVSEDPGADEAAEGISADQIDFFEEENDPDATPVTVSPYSSPTQEQEDSMARARGRGSIRSMRSRRSQSSSSEGEDRKCIQATANSDNGSTLFSTPAHGNSELTPFKEHPRMQELKEDDVASWVRDIYTRYNPSKLSRVDALVEKYQGREEDLVMKVQHKYRLGPDAFRPPKPAFDCGRGVCSPVGLDAISLTIKDCGLQDEDPREELVEDRPEMPLA